MIFLVEKILKVSNISFGNRIISFNPLTLFIHDFPDGLSFSPIFDDVVKIGCIGFTLFKPLYPSFLSQDRVVDFEVSSVLSSTSREGLSLISIVALNIVIFKNSHLLL